VLTGAALKVPAGKLLDESARALLLEQIEPALEQSQ
jgi:hypothetical protein